MSWGQILVDALSSRADAVPPEWSTSAQISEETGKRGSHLRATLLEAINQGRVERRSFRLLINGTIRSIPHYREVK